jgi:hypothetical protein
MRYHFTISYSTGFAEVSDWLRRRAADDPLMALREGMHGQYSVLVTAAENIAQWQQEQLDAGRDVIAGLCTIEVFPDAASMRVNLECGDAEIEVAARLLKDLLKEFPNFSVYDEDRRERITDLVRADASEIFKPETHSLA